MEVIEVENSTRGRYTLTPGRINNEDILFCIDVDSESLSEMKSTGAGGRPLTRLESIKQAILLFINTKLTINPDHRFAFATLSKSASWVRKEFSSELDSAVLALRGVTATSSCGQADLTQLFRIAAHEAKKSQAQNRILRVILIYCRSSVRPHHQWPVSQKLFTMDVMYLHDKPGPDNCPQEVYDSLVDALEHVSEYEGFIQETGQGVRTLLRYMSMLLAHPQQRVSQDDMGIPKSITKSCSLLHRRQFFHSHRAQPMEIEQVLSDRDSEDEVDDGVADFEDRRMLDDFVDVTKDEKQIMHLWNSFVRKQRVLADGRIPWACEAFSRLHGRDLVRAPPLIWCWRLFMIKLWNHGLLDARTMNNCNIILEQYKKQELDPMKS